MLSFFIPYLPFLVLNEVVIKRYIPQNMTRHMKLERSDIRILQSRLLLLRFSMLTLLAAHFSMAQSILVSVLPDADAFIRSLDPAGNYGGGGALSISGSAAVNGSGEQNGLFDSLMRFSLSNAVASFDSAFGTQSWVITKVRLIANEMAAPDNAIFNRGV